MKAMPQTNNFFTAFKQEFKTLKFNRNAVQDYVFVFIGVLMQGLAMRMFLVPAHLVSGGISGAAQLVNHVSNFPIGLMVFLGNVPLFFLGWRYLGGLRFALRTAFAIVFFSFFTDFTALFIPETGVTNDLVLNSLFGAILYGFGLGIVYKGKGTSGGSDILGRILNHKFGISISSSYLITDSIVVLLGGFVFGWEHALYGLIVIYVSGLAAEMAFEGRAIYRSAMIVSEKPVDVSQAILHSMDRGVTMLHGEGAYTHRDREVLYVVITQSEIPQLKEIVKAADERAFMVIGQVHEALGEGFRPLQNDN